MSDETFEELVADALDEVPTRFLDMLDNVVFFVEAEPEGAWPDVLGLYEGVPQTERFSGGGPPSLPDRITLYRGPLLRLCRDAAEVRREVTITVVHEIAHHFGIDDDRLHELGWA